MVVATPLNESPNSPRRVCRACGGEFITAIKQKRHCSPVCKRATRQEIDRIKWAWSTWAEVDIGKGGRAAWQPDIARMMRRTKLSRAQAIIMLGREMRRIRLEYERRDRAAIAAAAREAVASRTPPALPAHDGWYADFADWAFIVPDRE